MPQGANPHGFWADPRQTIGARLWQDRTTSPQGMAWLERVARPGATLVDVGANVGEWTLSADRLGMHSCAFEPQIHHASRLRELLRDSQSHVHPLALGDADGALELHQPLEGMNDGATSAHPAPGWARLASVPMRRFDDFWTEHHPDRPIHGVKIDVEGHEAKVLEGMRGSLERWRPWVWVEVNPETLGRAGSCPDALADLLGRAGYVHMQFYPYRYDASMGDSLWFPRGEREGFVVSLDGRGDTMRQVKDGNRPRRRQSRETVK